MRSSAIYSNEFQEELGEPRLVEEPKNDTLTSAGCDLPPLLNGGEPLEVTAQCIDIEKFHAYKRDNLKFLFKVIEPEKYRDEVLPCFAAVRQDKRKRLNTSSKLFKMALIATGSRRIRGIRKSMFQGKLFACEVETTGEGTTAYSVVRNILRKVAG